MVLSKVFHVNLFLGKFLKPFSTVLQAGLDGHSALTYVKEREFKAWLLICLMNKIICKHCNILKQSGLLHTQQI